MRCSGVCRGRHLASMKDLVGRDFGDGQGADFGPGIAVGDSGGGLHEGPASRRVRVEHGTEDGRAHGGTVAGGPDSAVLWVVAPAGDADSREGWRSRCQRGGRAANASIATRELPRRLRLSQVVQAGLPARRGCDRCRR